MKRPPAAAPEPVLLRDVDAHLRPAALALYDATSGRDRLAVLPVLALLGVPDVQDRLEQLYPTLRRAADRAKALRIALEVSAPNAPRSHSEAVLLAMVEFANGDAEAR